MVSIQVSEKTIKAIKNYLETHNIANRGIEDGSKRKQAVGLAGEFVVHNYLLGYYPDLENKIDGFDGGFDLVFKGLKIDVKTMERKCFVKPFYSNNLYAMQSEYNSDVIVFCSYNSLEKIVEVCGWIYKSELKDKSKFYKKGDKRGRSDGSSFAFRQDNYEIINKDLTSIEALKILEQKPK